MKKLLLLLTVTVLLAGPAFAALSLSATIRDFKADGVMFEGPIMGLETGMVAGVLGGDGKPVFVSSTTVPNAAAFNTWYNTGGTNMALPYTIEAEDIGGGLYQYCNDSFFPIDGLGFGNESLSHNYHFTLEQHSTFSYQAGQEFSFTGDDDLWVFIDDKLVIDLGGVHAALTSSVDLDTLGLTTGNNYSFDLFFAERHTTQSKFCITTSIELTPIPAVPAPGALLLAGMGAGFVGWLRWRRAL